MATSSLLGYTISISPPLLVALRLTPLLSTTASMTHAYMEWLAMSSFLTPPNLDTRLARAMIATAPPSKTSTNRSTTTTTTTTSHQKTAAPTKKVATAAENVLIPRWFVSLFSTGLYSVVGLNSITLFSSLANMYIFPHGTHPLGSNQKVYITGLVAAVAHYAFVPLVGRSVGALFGICAEGGKEVDGGREGEGREEEEEEGSAKGWVGEWVGWHVVRWGSVDLVAWGSFLIGGVGALV